MDMVVEASEGISPALVGQEIKQVQVGLGSKGECAIDASYSGPLTIPSEVNGYRVVKIGNYALADTPNLTAVYIPDGAYQLAFNAFENSGLTSVRVPNNADVYGDNNLGYHDVYIASKAFLNCKRLAAIEFPESYLIVKQTYEAYEGGTELTVGYLHIESKAFMGCVSLKSVRLPEGTKYAYSDAFTDCTGLEEITLPSSLQSMGQGSQGAFNVSRGNTLGRLKSVYSYMTEPIKICGNEFGWKETYTSYGGAVQDTIFDAQGMTATLYVPVGTKQKYESTYCWYHFPNIVELPSLTAVEPVRSLPMAGEACYGLDGRKQPLPRRGLNIVRRADGTIRKVFVK